jgi:hypothetical protein
VIIRIVVAQLQLERGWKVGRDFESLLVSTVAQSCRKPTETNASFNPVCVCVSLCVCVSVCVCVCVCGGVVVVCESFFPKSQTSVAKPAHHHTHTHPESMTPKPDD